MMDLTWIEKGEVNKIDLQSIIDETENMVLKKKERCESEKNVCMVPESVHFLCSKHNIENEHDDVALVRVFQSIKSRYILQGILITME